MNRREAPSNVHRGDYRDTSAYMDALAENNRRRAEANEAQLRRRMEQDQAAAAQQDGTEVA